MNRHPLNYDTVLEQPDPPPLREWAMFDREQPCVNHSVAYRGEIPCTGPLQCYLCGTQWDDDGKADTLEQRRVRYLQFLMSLAESGF